MKKLHTIDFNEEIKEKIQQFLEKKGVYENPIIWGAGENEMHYGVNCLVNIPDNLITEIMSLDEKGMIQYRNTKHIIEKEDLAAFQQGDKVTIIYLDTDFFPIRNQKGIVHSIINNKKLVIRAYKKKNKGWIISEGDNCILKKGWDEV